MVQRTPDATAITAAWQARSREELLARLDYFSLAPRVVLGLGADVGHSAAALARRFGNARVFAVDPALPMLQVAGRQLGWRERFLGGRFGHPFTCIAADARALPLADGCVDLVFGHCMRQRRDALDATLAEIRRVCAPRALFTLSTFGPTMSPVDEFVDLHDLGSALVRAGFQEPVLDVDRHHDRLDDEQVSWEIMYATAFAAADIAATGAAAADEVVVPLARLGRQTRA